MKIKPKSYSGFMILAAITALGGGCTQEKAGGGDAGQGGGGSSPVSVQFTQEGGSGAAGSAGLALADVSGRTDFGGTLAVTSYSIELNCDGRPYILQGGRMIVRTGETACGSKLTDVTVADQHGLIAQFESQLPDVAAGQPPKIMGYIGPDSPLQNQMKLLLSGKADPDGRDVAYSFTVKNIAAGDNTTGTNGGDTGAASSVTVAGVPLPDVEPTLASAWTSVTYGAQGVATKSYRASVQANSPTPCGSSATYKIELFGQTNATTAVKVAGGLGSVAANSAAERTMNSFDAGALISDCRGLSTNLYLKLSCTDNALGALNKGTSYKVVTIETLIPSSPYEGQGPHTSYLCANAAVDGFVWDDGTAASQLPKLGVMAVFASSSGSTDPSPSAIDPRITADSFTVSGGSLSFNLAATNATGLTVVLQRQEADLSWTTAAEVGPASYVSAQLDTASLSLVSGTYRLALAEVSSAGGTLSLIDGATSTPVLLSISSTPTDPTSSDTAPPTIGVLTVTGHGTHSVTLDWTQSNDYVTPASSLSYQVWYEDYNGQSDNSYVLGTYTTTKLGLPATGLYSKEVTGLSSDRNYIFTVAVKDAAGNTALYSNVQQKTKKRGTIDSHLLSPDATGGTLTLQGSCVDEGDLFQVESSGIGYASCSGGSWSATFRVGYSCGTQLTAFLRGRVGSADPGDIAGDTFSQDCPLPTTNVTPAAAPAFATSGLTVSGGLLDLSFSATNAAGLTVVLQKLEDLPGGGVSWSTVSVVGPVTGTSAQSSQTAQVGASSLVSGTYRLALAAVPFGPISGSASVPQYLTISPPSVGVTLASYREGDTDITATLTAQLPAGDTAFLYKETFIAGETTWLRGELSARGVDRSNYNGETSLAFPIASMSTGPFNYFSATGWSSQICLEIRENQSGDLKSRTCKQILPALGGPRDTPVVTSAVYSSAATNWEVRADSCDKAGSGDLTEYMIVNAAGYLINGGWFTCQTQGEELVFSNLHDGSTANQTGLDNGKSYKIIGYGGTESAFFTIMNKDQETKPTITLELVNYDSPITNPETGAVHGFFDFDFHSNDAKNLDLHVFVQKLNSEGRWFNYGGVYPADESSLSVSGGSYYALVGTYRLALVYDQGPAGYQNLTRAYSATFQYPQQETPPQ